MESVKSAKLRIELKDVSGCGKIIPCFTIQAGSQKLSANLKSTVTTESLELNSSNFLTISALNGEKLLGSARLQVDSFFAGRDVTKSEKWLKVKTEDFQNFRVKVLASLIFCETITKEKLKTVKIVKEKTEKAEECPYLSSLVTGHGMSSEPLDDIWRLRNISKEKSISLSFQPDEDPGGSEGLDLATLQFDDLRSMNGDQLKNVVRNLCQEVKSLENVCSKLKDFKNTFDSKSDHRRKLEIEAKDELVAVQTIVKDSLLKFQNLVKTRDDFQEKLREKRRELISLKKQKDLLLQEERDWKEQTLYNSIISRSQQHKSSLQEQKENHFCLVNSSRSQQKSEISSFESEISALKQQLKLTGLEYEETRSANSNLKRKINDLHQALESCESRYFFIQDSFSNRASLGSSRDSLNQSVMFWLPEAKAANVEVLKASQDLNSKKSSVVSESESLSREASSQSTTSRRDSVRGLESMIEKTRLSAVQTTSADLTSLALDISKLKHLYIQTRSVILPELDSGSSLLNSQSEQIFHEAVKIDSMMDSADQQEEKLDSLKGTMGQVKKQQILHIPVKSDPVDVALADYVNSNKIPVKFVRQDNGNYFFGSTKVYIKLENSKLIVRVKGGTTSIKEFLDIYTNIEVGRSDSPKPNKNKTSSRPSIIGKSPGLAAKN